MRISFDCSMTGNGRITHTNWQPDPAAEKVDAVLKLTIELVPATCRFESLREQMRRSEWDRLRKKVCTEQGN